MAGVTGFTAARMRLIEAASIISGAVNASGRLILSAKDGSTIDAGNVRGPAGPAGVAPTGSIFMYCASNSVSGYLYCQGQTISRTTYAALFNVIGSSYGAGDGSTTFQLPDLRGRIGVGRVGGDADFATLGLTGGSKTHLLSIEEMPAHTHVQNPHTHQQVVVHTNGTTGSLTSRADFDADTTTGRVHSQNGAITTDTTAVNQNTGGGRAHNNVQPYLVVNYLIKT